MKKKILILCTGNSCLRHDLSEATGTPEFIESEFHRVRDEIKNRFYVFYLDELKKIRICNHGKKTRNWIF